MHFLHDHRYCVLTENVNRSIMVRIEAKAALATAERRLAFVGLPAHGFAGREGLRDIAQTDKTCHRQPADLCAV